MRMDEHLVADKQYRISYQFNERNVSHIDLHLVFPKNIYSFDEEKWRPCKI